MKTQFLIGPVIAGIWLAIFLLCAYPARAVPELLVDKGAKEQAAGNPPAGGASDGALKGTAEGENSRAGNAGTEKARTENAGAENARAENGRAGNAGAENAGAENAGAENGRAGNAGAGKAGLEQAGAENSAGAENAAAGKSKADTNSREQIALQLPPPHQLQRNLGFSLAQSKACLSSIQSRASAKLRAAGFDPSISLDEAINSGKTVLCIYLRKYSTQNFVSKQFVIEGSIIQYGKKGNGAPQAARYKHFGQSAEVYIPAEFADKAVNLVEVYINDRKHAAELARKLGKAAKSTGHKKGR